MSKWIIAIMLAIVSLPGLAQTIVSEPEFSDVFFALDSGKLLPLERQTSAIKAGGGGFMVASSKAAYTVTGSASPVRLHLNMGTLDFIVRSAFAATAVDPGTIYILRKMDSKKKGREIVYSSGHFSPIGGSMNISLTQGSLPLAFARYGQSSIKLTTGRLEPGEYALSRAYGADLFCFGID